MSALTVENISVIARRRLNVPDSLRFQPLVNQALLSLARKVARRDDYIEIRKEVSVAAVSGVITISDAALLIEMIDKTGVLVLNNIETKFLPRYDDLRAKLPSDIYYAAFRNRKLYVKDVSTGNLGSANVTGTLDASYTPTLSQLPAIYDEELIDEVVKLATGRTETTAESIEGNEEDATHVRIDAND